ncbi:MAG: 2-C-methyl-D-erythritol 4-phosphate cytidylyltransferase [Cyclobacteriaceae bacterium]
MEKSAIIVAGGSGIRMGSTVPKQFLLLKDKPILMHTLQAFFDYDPQLRILLVLPANEQERWQNLCRQHQFTIPHQVVNGGADRSASVRNGLAALPQSDGLVAIHDGVRPLVSQQIIAHSFEMAARIGNAITSVVLKDSIRQIDGEESWAVDRATYRLVQTPQTFRLSLIREAYSKAGQESRTDDASVFEAAGGKVHLIEGDYVNLKITTKEDLKVAEALMETSA